MRRRHVQKSRKDQGMAAAQVFVYIMMIIVFAVIIIFGYRAIASFLQRGEQVAFTGFKIDVERAVRDIYSDFGSVVVYDRRNPLRLGSGFDEVCFVDLDRPAAGVSGSVVCDSTPGNSEYRPLLCDAWSSSAGGWRSGAENVFVFPPRAGTGGIGVLRITVDTDGDGQENPASDEGWLCVPVVDGIVSVRMEGKGDHAFISEVPI